MFNPDFWILQKKYGGIQKKDFLLGKLIVHLFEFKALFESNYGS